jgi:hypothetical protein
MYSIYMKSKNFDVIIVGIALLALVGLFYNNQKNKNRSTYVSTTPLSPAEYVASPQPYSDNGSVAPANGLVTNTYNMKPSEPVNPDSLLPNDANSQWAALNPTGSGSLQNVNLLQAGSMIGINTQGTYLKNANLQLRSEPPIPKAMVGPWNNSTIEVDTMARPFEIGSGTVA